jgi:double-strand break repair protein MRE11
MRDERLNRMWNGKKVSFLRPAEDVNDEDEDDSDSNHGFFNIFILHQNRDLGRGSKNCIQESMIPEWMDLVVWGHEHECLIEFFESVVGTFRITQPGSSVATSLVAGEAARKKIGILDIVGKQFRLHTVPLTQVRSFVTCDLCLKEHREELDPDGPHIDERVTAALEEEVRVMTLNAKEKRKELLEAAIKAGSDAGTDDSPLKCKLEKPHRVLIRLRVEHSGFSTLNNTRFGAKFVGDVANPEDILLFHRKKDPKASSGTKTNKKPTGPIAPEDLVRTDMEDLVNTHLEAPESKLLLLSEKVLGEALDEFVDKSLMSSLDDATDGMLVKRQKILVVRKVGEPNSIQHADNSMDQDTSHSVDTSSPRGAKRKAPRLDESLDLSDDGAASKVGNGKNHRALEEDESDEIPPPKQRSKKTAKVATKPLASAKGARPAQGDAKRKAARLQKIRESDSDDSNVEVVAPPKSNVPVGRPRRTTSARKVQYNVDDDKSEEAFSDALDSDDDDLSVEKPKRKISTKPSAKKPVKPALTKGTAKRAPRGVKRRKFDDDDSDDDHAKVAGSSADLDDDWGTANTRSQI